MEKESLVFWLHMTSEELLWGRGEEELEVGCCSNATTLTHFPEN